MGMPITVEVLDATAGIEDLEPIFSYFHSIDERFSVFKPTSEISRINSGDLEEGQYSDNMRTILKLSEETKTLTNGYFDIHMPDGRIDPSGLVKGWAIYRAALMLNEKGFKSFYVEAGGDIQHHGLNRHGEKWRVGIRNPFNVNEIIKVVHVGEEGVATSGTYIRGQHVFDPFQPKKPITEVVSLTVIGPNIYEADRFATAAFAMRERGIDFIEKLKNFEGYQIDNSGRATMTSGFEQYLLP